MERQTSCDIPRIDELLKKLQGTNRRIRLIVLLEALSVPLLLSNINWTLLATHPLTALVVCGMMVGPHILALLRIALQNKKALTDIREDAKFGTHTKHDLLEYVRQVELAMGIPRGETKVFLVREKGINASAIQIGLAGIFPSLNAIYINRGAIHSLRAEELKSVIGHEIAHNSRHYLEWKRWTLLHMVFGLSLGLYLSSWCPPGSSTALFVPLGVSWFFELLQGMYYTKYAHTLEFLCDAAGAQATTIQAAITAEVRIGCAAEAYEKALLYALERKAAGSAASAKEVLEALEESLSFGNSDGRDVIRELEARVSSLEARREGLSLSGFLQFIGFGGDTAASEEALANQINALKNRAERVSDYDLPKNRDFSLPELEQLISKIENNPKFRLFIESDEDKTSHPSTSRRILFIWKNRNEIPGYHHSNPKTCDHSSR